MAPHTTGSAMTITSPPVRRARRRDSTTQPEQGAPSRVVFKPAPAISTQLGKAYCGDSAQLMKQVVRDASVDLIMTSPPFGLVRKKDYGNEDADRYVAWFEKFAKQFARV